jgi:hypothetical protein
VQHRKLPSLSALRSRLSYDPLTGILRWNEAGRGRRVGKIAGSKTAAGYWQVCTLGGVWRAHRVIWKMMTGKDPGHREVDHKNRKRLDNRWKNLRLLPRWAQTVNSTPRESKTGYTGVYRRRANNFYVQIKARGKRRVTVGTFRTLKAAIRARRQAARVVQNLLPTRREVEKPRKLVNK